MTVVNCNLDSAQAAQAQCDAALARVNAAVEKLDSVQQARGIDKAVDRYVDEKLPKRTDKKSKPTKNVNQPHLVEVRCPPILAASSSLPSGVSLTHGGYVAGAALACDGGSKGYPV